MSFSLTAELLARAMALPANPSRAFDPSSYPKARPAAVMVLVRLGDAPELIVVERAQVLADHPGELGFPGGKRDPSDADLLATAMRETREEIGLEPSAFTVAGPLVPCPVITGLYEIHPFVGALASEVAPQPTSREIERVLALPLAPWLAGARTIEAVTGKWRGHQVVSPYFPVADRVLYGASASIGFELIERLAQASGRTLPPFDIRPTPPWATRYAELDEIS